MLILIVIDLTIKSKDIHVKFNFNEQCMKVFSSLKTFQK